MYDSVKRRTVAFRMISKPERRQIILVRRACQPSLPKFAVSRVRYYTYRRELALQHIRTSRDEISYRTVAATVSQSCSGNMGSRGPDLPGRAAPTDYLVEL